MPAQAVRGIGTDLEGTGCGGRFGQAKGRHRKLAEAAQAVRGILVKILKAQGVGRPW